MVGIDGKFQPWDPPPKTIKTSPALLAMLVPLFRPGNDEELLKVGSTSRSPENGGNSHDHIVPTSKKYHVQKSSVPLKPMLY